jgi:hypothetical protein
MWFETLTGFREESPEQVRKFISHDGDVLKSLCNGRTFACGQLDVLSLEELRKLVHDSNLPSGELTMREVVADVQDLHTDETNSGALFQVASQFNLLEMTSPDITPEQGIERYEYDRTQGPACAIAAGAGTIFRNYFADVDGQVGQSEDNQIDCLFDLGAALGNSQNRLWEMKNGYALATEYGLAEITEKLQSASMSEIDTLKDKLRIGLQWNTEVTLAASKHTVSQAFCSALPVAYSNHSAGLWSEFAQFILDATYEATFCAAVLNYSRTGNNSLFLTLIGGGAFGNRPEWISNAINRSLRRFKSVGLDVILVSYGQPYQDLNLPAHESFSE